MGNVVLMLILPFAWAARESVPAEIEAYRFKMRQIFMYPEQRWPACLHMYRELQDAIHQTGARLIFLLPYSPELNPIEVGFGRLKAWIQKHANLVFPLYPEKVLEIAMPLCTAVEGTPNSLKLFGHCGYDWKGLREELFNLMMTR